MNHISLAKYIGLSILLVSAIIYVIGDPITKLLSYQGPVIGGGLIGWYALISNNKDKYVEDELGEKYPLISVAYRKYSVLVFLLSLIMIIPWLTPYLFKIEEQNQILFAASFSSMLVGGFLLGYFIPSLKFIEKVFVFSLGFLADILYFFIIYLASSMFGVPQSSVVNAVLFLVFGLKFPEGVIFSLYIARKVKGI